MPPTHALELTQNRGDCELRSEAFFCNLSPAALRSFEALKYSMPYSEGAVLFLEGQPPPGIFVVSKGRVKLSVRCSEGRSIILRIASKAGPLPARLVSKGSGNQTRNSRQAHAEARRNRSDHRDHAGNRDADPRRIQGPQVHHASRFDLGDRGPARAGKLRRPRLKFPLPPRRRRAPTLKGWRPQSFSLARSLLLDQAALTPSHSLFHPRSSMIFRLGGVAFSLCNSLISWGK